MKYYKVLTSGPAYEFFVSHKGISQQAYIYYTLPYELGEKKLIIPAYTSTTSAKMGFVEYLSIFVPDGYSYSISLSDGSFSQTLSPSGELQYIYLNKALTQDITLNIEKKYNY